jgi:hypothetical protein
MDINIIFLKNSIIFLTNINYTFKNSIQGKYKEKEKV